MITDALRRFFAAHAIEGGPLIVAVSGGVDSSALLMALAELGTFDLVAAHVNHQLRGAESDEDEAFVRDLCATLGVPLRAAGGALDADAVRHRGVEAAAREVRHARLHEIRAEAGARFIATAHQKNDQAETIVMRLMTGGGIAALRGIHPVRDDGVIRPLLDVTRAEIERFLAERGIAARFDRTNADPRFVRNRVRVLLRELGAEAIENIASVAAQARQAWEVLERAVDAAEDVEATADATRFRSLPEDPWLRQALLRRHIGRLDPDARDVDVVRLAGELDSGKRISVTKSLELEDCVLGRVREPVPHFEVALTPDQPARVPGAVIRVTPATQQPSNQVIQLPKGADPHFTIRNRLPGDRFQPLGFPHEKKLKDVLIDRKIAARIRDRIPLLIWNGAIVWVAGVEVSEKFKVTVGDADRYEVSIEEEAP
ncbi:MAG: tRNA lysidine(34) synthetase TilS [Acidobacteriota bacterium]